MMEQNLVHPFLATFAVSIIPIGMLLAIPSLSQLFFSRSSAAEGKLAKGKKKENGYGELPINTLMCFAAGSLLADSLEHIVEEASEGKAGNVVPQVLSGIFFFFAIDRLSRLAHKYGDGHAHSTGYLSLIADAVHNFTDGLAIAASFAKSMKSGVSTSVAIFMHEIPHELGDYAILAKSGFTHASIIKVQLLTAAAAFFGTSVGMAIESDAFIVAKEQHWLLPVTCGGFLYLALCSLLSEVVTDERRNRSFRNVVVDSGAFLAGIALLKLFDF